MNNNLDLLLQAYSTDPRIVKIAQLIQSQEGSVELRLSGLVGSQEAFVLHGLQQQLQGRHHLFIANDQEDAAYLQGNLETLLDPTTVLFFPDSFKRPAFFEELNPGNALMRTEAIHRLSSKGHKESLVLVTYPEALFEKVVDPHQLEKTRIDIKTGQDFDVDFVTSILVEYGFTRVDFVYEPGQFSVRGGIIDVFSHGNEQPYRVELFDTEVESIRLFDPETQLSTKNLSSFSIIPNINTRFQQDQKIPLFSLLPPTTLLWWRDEQYVLDKLQDCYDKAMEYANSISALDESELADLMRDRAFLRTHEIVESLQEFTNITVSNGGNQSKENVFTFSSLPQPSFNKNFKLLIEHLHDHKTRGITNYIFTDSSRQIERFYAIFEDLKAEVQFHPILQGIHQGFIDPELKVACYTDHQIFERYHRYKVRKGYGKDQALSIKALRELQNGDFVTHIDHGIGKYTGLEKITVNGQVQECVRLVYKNNDILYVSINSLHKISRFVGKDGEEPQLNKLGSDAWQNLKRKTKNKLKDIAKDLIALYARRKAAKGHGFAPDSYLQTELEASFIYEDTPDQLKSTQDVKEDMEKPYPMDRLICGDVGFGKTEVAIRAAFKCILDGKQVAVLVPTTILALQHYRTFKERLESFSVSVDYVNRFRTAADKKKILEQMQQGSLDLVIGTHALLNKETKFKDLGLLIIDEEQKFGVAAKERLRNLKVNVDTLTLTATPIPRTLQFSLMAARDLSVIRTPPPNRQPIQTEVRVFTEEVVKEAIYYEIQRGGQVFLVHNRVQSLPEMMAMVQKICPDVDVAMAHGQMDPEALEKTLVDFIERRYDVLVCTNIIETGLDIPNANTIIINNAHQFGLSDLHQLRGRVGRSNRKAFCYLFAPPVSVLTTDARKRLKTIEEFSDLGSGFHIAMRDLDIRGAGNLLGAEQSGFIADIGYETYQKILEEAMHELKHGEFKALFKEELDKQQTFVRDVVIETDTEMHIPNEYVESIQERLSLYTELDAIETEEGITAYADKLQDRFGKLPYQVKELFEGLRLRWIAKELGLERVVIKEKKLRCYFIADPQSVFYDTPFFQELLKYITLQGAAKGLGIKQSAKSLMLVKDHVGSVRSARQLLAEVKAGLAVGTQVGSS